MKNWKSLIIEPEISIRVAMQTMDQVNSKLLIVCSDQKFISVLSIGDIQRAILASFPLDTKIEKILRQSVIFSYVGDSKSKVKDLMLRQRIEAMPVISNDGSVSDVIFWEQIFKDEENFPNNLPNIPVVIMAGGKGTRLKPITNIIPKPLIPLGEKPILDWIITSFNELGVKKFYLTVNYKQDMIRSYFENKTSKDYDLQYFEESQPLGTAGSLHLLKGKLKETFFVTNCDILIRDDYASILNYHNENKNELTIVSAVKHLEIPYGTLEFGRNGVLEEIKEKPEFNFFINAGMYILEPHLLDEIPENKFFHITTLIEKIIQRSGKVGVFPVSEGSWMDIGQWDEYNKTAKKLGLSGINIE